MVRPWGLSAPIVVLLICLPLMRPLRHPDPSLVSDDEQARLATIQAIVEHRSLAIENTQFHTTRNLIVTPDGHSYSDQSPVMAALLSGPYWVMYRCGLSLDKDPVLTEYLLTLLGVTLPIAFGTGLLYRMGRMFELRRPYRAALALGVVVASGWISYGTVLNAGAAAAALVVLGTGCLVQATLTSRRGFGFAWCALAGLSLSLAATYELTAAVFLVLLLPVLFAFRWPVPERFVGAGLYVAAMAFPLLLYGGLNKAVTGDLKPGFLHPEWRSPDVLVAHSAIPNPDAGDDEEGTGFWNGVGRACGRIFSALMGAHGLLSHFPILLLGILGVTMVMHRHWPGTTKILASAAVAGASALLLAYGIARTEWKDAMFANRWFLVFLPMVLFWSGAWLRKSHRASSWAMAAVLLCFSTVTGLVGATDPQPRQGYDDYTAKVAFMELVSNSPPPSAQRTRMVTGQ
jgi:hypothetical protein